MIATAAVQNLLGGDPAMARARSPEIVADAAHVILTQPSRKYSGNFALDEDVLQAAGISDLSGYSAVPAEQLLPDLFL